MKTLTYGGTNYYVSDDVAWVMRFYHRLLVETRQTDLVDFPAHTDEIRNTIGMVELGGDIPYSPDVDYPSDDEPEGAVEFRFYKDESISALLNYMTDHIEGGFDTSGYSSDIGKTIAELEERWVAFLKAEREREREVGG